MCMFVCMCVDLRACVCGVPLCVCIYLGVGVCVCLYLKGLYLITVCPGVPIAVRLQR